MKLRKTVLLMAAALMVTSATSSFAHVSTNSQSFWNKNEEGWFWYKQDPEKLKPKKKEEKPKIVVAESKKEEKKEESKSEAPSIFSADWVKENLEVYKKVAWDNPTVENLRAYMYLQRFAMDRSEQFAYAGQMAVQGDPYLDEVARAPLGGHMTKSRGYLISGEQNYVLKKLFKRVGVFFVFKNDCYVCDEQAKVLKIAQKEFNMEVAAVSLDEPNERSVAAKEFPDYIVNPGIAQKHAIRALPATFFMTEDKEIRPLIQGFVTMNDLNRRSLTMAQKYNWLPPEDFNLIKPVDDSTSLASVLTSGSELANRLETMKTKANPYGKDTNYVDPSTLVEMIKKERDRNTPADFIPRGY